MLRRLSLLIASALTVSGCVVPQQPDFDSRLIMPTQTARDGSRLFATPQYTSSVAGLYPQSCLDFDATATASIEQRNACITDLKTEIDAAYGQYEIKINQAISGTDVTFDTTALVTGTAAPAVSGVAAKILSSMTSAATNGKNIFNQDVLYKVTLQILVSTMQADRAKDAAAMQIAMQSPLNVYSMAQAKNDLVEYLYAGTLTHALAQANQNASAVAQKCQAVKKVVQATAPNDASASLVKAQAATAGAAAAGGATTTSDQCNAIVQTITVAYSFTGAGKALEAFWKPDGKTYNSTNEASLKSCMSSVLASSKDPDVQSWVTNGDITSVVRTANVSESDKLLVLTCAIAKSGATPKAKAPAPKVKAPAPKAKAPPLRAKAPVPKHAAK